MDMKQEWLDKVEKFEEEVNNPEIPIEKLEVDYETWCYAVGKAWSIMRCINPDVFLGLPEGATMLTARNTVETLEKLIRKYYPSMNKKLSHDRRNISSVSRIIMSAFLGYEEGKDTFPSKVDLEHQELLVYGFNNVR